MTTIEISQDYGYVLAAAVSTFLVSSWLGARVSPFRKAAKIPYPYEYASYEQVQTAPPQRQKALDTFNRAQRGHQNFNENHLSMLGSLFIAGITRPKLAAGMGLFWSVNRVLYGIGYTRGGEKGRYWGVGWMLAQYGLIIMAGKTAWDVVMA
ncbi:hypothetical protein BDV96DRAFT_606970 [Lophiotrema nucula]|uniref:Membrane-associated proteins in eicosanoid and glutathione metabolism n=1 Tax=Lophiotrema nucula TaxID=690887 RepID=A0A6A5YI59_9PLEO|nr:hypothetical protein BDV96DRAFT_606970 [Lophiotrema nucula]